MSKNFTFISKADYEDGLFSDGIKQVQVDLYQDHILRLKVNYTNQSLPHYSTFVPKFSKVSHNQVLESEKQVEFKIDDLDFIFNKDNFSLQILEKDKTILQSREEFIGFSGEQTMFQFYKENSQPFWGFGSKTGSLNKENQITKMWNLDVVASHPNAFYRDDYDPGYVSIPFFITKINGRFFGFYLDNPDQTFFNTGKDTNFLKMVDEKIRPKFYFGSYHGECQLFIFTGKNFKDIVTKFSKFSGVGEIPPLWSLGKHQCKWSYMNKQEVQKVADKYQENEIPLDTIWLDIDYMDNFKSFTFDEKNYGTKKELAQNLHSRGLKLVTMLDPGLKEEDGYFAFDEAVNKDLLCKTFGDKYFVGHVWPGDTVFPDFSMIETRKWWADKVADFVKDGVDGIWIDMNDPSTGSVDSSSMLFKKGTVQHSAFHNQYANLMAKATKQGVLKANPKDRPFILTRSAYTGIQNYAAVWTGDNVSNWEHLAMSIPQSVNLSLSGVNFNGPDVGGFMHLATEELMVRWYQAGFLFPFFRNHDNKHTFGLAEGRDKETYQEPYRFSKSAMENMKKWIQLRYRLLPYIYDGFYNHYQTGEPILRPMFYNHDNPEYYSIQDQFFVGESIMQAPIINQNNDRKITLPKGWWYELNTGQWLEGGKTMDWHCELYQTPIFIKDQSIIPTYKQDKFSSTGNLNKQEIEFWIFNKENQDLSYKHYQDDGQSLDYQKGKYNIYEIQIKPNSNQKEQIQTVKKDYLEGEEVDFSFRWF